MSMTVRGPAVCVVLASLTTASPSGSPQRGSEAVIQQRFVCDRSYINFAWGYQHMGVYVDREGGIYRFSASKPVSENPAGPADRTEAAMEAKYGPATQVGTVDRKTLLSMYQLIPPAARGRQTERVHAAYDAGSWVSACYLYDAATKRYREVELEVKGDWEHSNLAPEARVLAAWLRSVEEAARKR